VKKHLIAAIGLFLAMTSFLVAQTATGVIRETVQDVTGSVLIHVHVKLVDEATNQIRQATSEQGSFEFRTLPSGNYRVEVEHPGAGMVNAAGFMTLPLFLGFATSVVVSANWCENFSSIQNLPILASPKGQGLLNHDLLFHFRSGDTG
jgi:hypothetical protein